MATAQPGQITDPKMALAYIFAGRTFTLRSVKTQARFTYKCVPADVAAHKAGTCNRYFVRVLDNPDNTRITKYIGQILNNEFMITKKTRDLGMSDETPCIFAFAASFKILKLVKEMAMLEFWHSGKCGRCGRKLTVPESVASGFGPECVHLVGYGAVGRVTRSSPTPIGAMTTSDGGSFLDRGMSGREAAAALYAPAVPAGLDRMIREAIEQYKADGPENYFQDGEVEEPEAFNAAYAMFRRELQPKYDALHAPEHMRYPVGGGKPVVVRNGNSILESAKETF